MIDLAKKKILKYFYTFEFLIILDKKNKSLYFFKHVKSSLKKYKLTFLDMTKWICYAIFSYKIMSAYINDICSCIH